MKIALFISGRGSLIKSFNEKFGDKLLLVVASCDCEGIQVAEALNIPTMVSAPDDTLLEILTRQGVTMICLAGYLKVIPADFLNKFDGTVLNSHPSLLPKYGGKGFYGMKVHDAVIHNGEKESGFTIHQVTAEVDEGPVLYQEKIEISEGETSESLAEKILSREKVKYPEIAKKLIG